MELSEEEKTLISMLNIVDTYIEDTKVTKVIFSMEDAKVLYDLIKRQQRKLKKVEDYITSYDFFNLLFFFIQLHIFLFIFNNIYKFLFTWNC